MSTSPHLKTSSVAGERALAKVVAVLGEQRGNALITKTLVVLRLTSIETADDCYRFGSALTRDGGVNEAIGRAIMVQAILAGAKIAES